MLVTQNTWRLWLAGLALVGSAAFSAAAAQPVYVTLQSGGHALQAELVDTPATLSRGLMHRKHLPVDSGMLFALGPASTYCFWMKNTLIPLSIAFIDADGRIVSIQDMQPLSLDTHCSPSDVTTALEMNQGWFRDKHIQVGDHVSGIPPR